MAADTRGLSPAAIEAASDVRLIIARTYGRADLAGARHWSVVPVLTTDGTVGIVDIARGTAWDTRQRAHPGTADLGLLDEAHAAANMTSGGTVYFDGVTVQQGGSAVVDGMVMPPAMPEGWQQIALPTWLGYGPLTVYGAQDVPVAEYRPERWLRPTLVATGLTTCYGRAGIEDGAYLARTGGLGAMWPHGLPEWIEGMATTVLDRIAYEWRDGRDEYPAMTRLANFRPTGRSRGTDQEEMEVMAPLVDAVRYSAVMTLTRISERRPGSRATKLSVDDAATLLACARQLAGGPGKSLSGADQAHLDAVEPVLHRAYSEYSVETPDEATECMRRLVDPWLRRSPWEVARVLALSPRVWDVLVPIWPAPAPTMPLGLAEVATRLGRARATVDGWRSDGLLPLPDGEVGGRPAWWTETVDRWARETGRLPT